MSRALIVALVAGLLSVGATAATVTAVLSEMLPWPMLSAGIPLRSIVLSDEPAEDLRGVFATVDSGSEVLYGLIPLGNGDDPGISVMVVLGSDLRLLVDTDNDEDLGDESGEYTREQIFAHAYSWYITVYPEYLLEGRMTQAAYHIGFVASYSYATDSFEFLYGGFCHRRGAVDLGGVLVPIAITSQVSTGRYDDTSSLLVCIDTDGDGELDTLPGSHEVYSPGELLQVGTDAYRIVSVSPDGGRVTLESAGKVPLRLPIRVGDVAPDFEGALLDGSKTRLSNHRGSIVVMVLELASQPRCAECGDTVQAADSRAEAICRELSDLHDDIVLMRVVSEPPVPATRSLPDSCPMLTVVAEAVSRIYRRAEGVFVLDRRGVIVAMDEAWSGVRCGQPFGRLDELNEFEILVTVERLLDLDEE